MLKINTSFMLWLSITIENVRYL